MSQVNTINYQALLGINKAASRAIKTALAGYRLPLYVVLEGLSILASVKAQNAWPAAIVIVAVVGHVSSLIKKYKSSAWLEFARDNGWTIDTATSELKLVPPGLNFGHSPEFSEVLLADLGGIKASLFTFECITGQGRFEQTHHFTVARVGLSTEVPHLFLMSKASHVDAVADLPDATQLKLEGDFDKYFKLLATEGKEVETLEIITPDIMQALITYNTNEDVEMIYSDVYFIIKNDKRSYQTMPNFIGSIYGLSAQLNENAKLAGDTSPAKTVVNSYT